MNKTMLKHQNNAMNIEQITENSSKKR